MFKPGSKARLWLILTVLILVFTIISGCTEKDGQVSNELHTIGVAVSIIPQASFVEAVGGDLVQVLTMIPPGASPENYAPSPKVMEQLSETDIYFTIGVPAEKDGILPRLTQVNPNMKVVDLPQLVDKIYPPREIAPGELDPHRWLSPKRAIVMVEAIAEELSTIDPEHSEIYKNNAQRYQAQLEQLHNEISTSLAGLAGQSFIIYHPSMGYFADDYGLNMIALEQEGKAATAQNIQSVIDQARKESITAVLYQAELDGKQAHTLAEELGGTAQLIAPLAADYIDNLRKTADVLNRIMKKP